MLPRLQDISAAKLKGKRVLVRLDLNVPFVRGRVMGDYRLRQSIPTLEFLRKAGAKIIIISHYDVEFSKTLRPIATHMRKFFSVGFVPDITGPRVLKMIQGMRNGDALILENLRTDPREEKNSRAFAQELASYADIYVNEAFSVSHRAHASIMGVPQYLPSFIGFLFDKECKALTPLRNPAKPFALILGGAKFETKLPLLRYYLSKTSDIILGGALANTFFKEQGFEMGKSVVAKKISGLKPFLKNKKISLPTDVVLSTGSLRRPEKLLSTEKITDIGPETVEHIIKVLKKTRTVLFNGPVGIYGDGFDEGTKDILKALVRSKAKVIVGGGDTLAVVAMLKLEKKFHFVSTAGGAMLEFLVKGTLPGIKAIEKKRK